MDRLRRAALLVILADKLRARGSWCGETHLQKAVYLLQELTSVPTDFDFLLYKHGPFSFELRDELTSMRADQLISYEPQPYPFGPRIAPTASGEQFTELYPKTLMQYQKALDFAAEAVGNSGVAELERVATGVYVGMLEGTGASVDERANRLVKLKPHVLLESARCAIERADELRQQASARL